VRLDEVMDGKPPLFHHLPLLYRAFTCNLTTYISLLCSIVVAKAWYTLPKSMAREHGRHFLTLANAMYTEL